MPRPLPDIDPKSWIHPHDEAAQSALRAIPGFDTLTKWLSKRSPELELRDDLAKRSLTGDGFDRVKALYDEVLKTLDAPTHPDLFYVAHKSVNAAAIGWQQPFIVVTTGCDALSDDAMRMMLGHELTHVLCDHMRFKFTAIHLRLIGWAAILANPLLAGLSVAGLTAALALWDRRSELTADRGGLLAAQSMAAPRALFSKVSSAQEDMVSELPPGLQQMVKVMNTHPDLVDRQRALDEWVSSGHYTRVVGGEYPRRSLEGRVADDAEYGAHLDAMAEIALLERKVDRGPSAAELEAIALKELEEFD